MHHLHPHLTGFFFLLTLLLSLSWSHPSSDSALPDSDSQSQPPQPHSTPYPPAAINISIHIHNLTHFLHAYDANLTFCHPSIPRRIHFIFWRDNVSETQLLAKEEACVQTYISDQWQIFIWDRHRLRQLISDKYPEIWHLMMTLHLGQLVDLARYVVLYDMGGVYSDLDNFLINGTLDDLLHCGDDRHTFTYAYASEYLRDDERDNISNAFLVTVSHGEVIKRIFIEAVTRSKARGRAKKPLHVMDTTGPLMMNDLYRQQVFNRSDVYLIPKANKNFHFYHRYRTSWFKDFHSHIHRPL